MLETTLSSFGVIHADFQAWVALRVANWMESGSPAADLRQVVLEILKIADLNHGPKLAQIYFETHRGLMTSYFMSHEEARALLTSAFFIGDLAWIERQSAAQIAKLLAAGRNDTTFTRQSVGYLTEKMGYKAVLTRPEVEALFSEDADAALEFFADADIAAACEIATTYALLLGFPSNLYTALTALAPLANLVHFPPYLQILHYQCTIAEYFDHAARDFYEFSPRGGPALWLFSQYPGALATAGNPYLNNAKSVGEVDESWVRSKKQNERPGAKALHEILAGLEQMRFAARREVAKVLRMWLHHVMRLSEPLTMMLPEQLTSSQIESLLNGVMLGNTGTYGIIEQRIVDAVSAARHRPVDGWRGRGLGDSVNTTNVSRKKIGDVDFQHAGNRKIIAYEAHGGELTDIYVDEHLRTLRKVIALRNEELAGIADLSEWEVTVVFIAHRISVEDRIVLEIDGLRVALIFQTFAQFLENSIDLEPDYKMYILRPLTEHR
ncbi:MAG: hypothetical protein EOP06_12140, partial [Proteobacteria bacterium]